MTVLCKVNCLLYNTLRYRGINISGGIIDRVTYSVSPENPRELTVNWNKHFKHELCMLEYHVVYSLDGMDDQSIYTAEPEARFDFEFCTKAMLMISTYGLAQTISGPTTTLDAVQCEVISV